MYRSEIQGLRAVAAFLIALHHIWFGRVSGGVDIFFVVSGFLLIGSLSREIESTGSIGIRAFLTRIARRIIPAAFVVIAATILGTRLFVSRVFWADTFEDIRSAISYTANMRFADTSVDYLAQSTFKTPVQHFWAMSIQGQFYLVLPFAVFALWRIGKWTRLPRQYAMPLLLGVVAAISFTYSVVRTPQTPEAMYFDTYARIWEFAVGGLLALLLPTIRVTAGLSTALSWIGIAMFIGTGVLITGTPFPGYIALVPVLGGLLLIVAGNQTVTSPTNLPMRILRQKYLVALGDYSYGFFLWHWPILVFMKAHLRTTSVSVTQGISVIGIALVLAYLTNRLVEQPFLRRRDGEKKHLSLLEMAAIVVVIAVAFSTTESFSNSVDRGRIGVITGQAELKSAAKTDGVSPITGSSLQELSGPPLFATTNPFSPDPLVAKRDLPIPNRTQCIRQQLEELLPKCSFIGKDGRPRIVLIGGSHSLQWFSPLNAIAQKHRMQLVVLSRAGCRFGITPDSYCNDWVQSLIEWMESDPPDYVFTTATIARNRNEVANVSFAENWRTVGKVGTHVFAIRDNPEFPYDIPACVEQNRSNPNECAYPRASMLAPINPAEQIADLPRNVTLMDLSDYLCSQTTCYAVRDNILMYRDSNHLTQTFALHLMPALEGAMRPIFERDGHRAVIK